MVINIRNMVCGSCIKVVTALMHELNIETTNIELGRVETRHNVEDDTLKQLRQRLNEEGFELLDNKNIKLVEQIKSAIIELVHYKDITEVRTNLSDYLSALLHRDYNYLSNLFSSIENTTIEQFFILQKIEKVKELLVYDEVSLSEIAYRLGYSSVAHLSNQFKKITGFTPTAFRKLKEHNRKPLDEV